jgi:hypothetical protein
MSQHGGDVIIDFSAIHAGDELVLKHVKIADLQASDFLFA